ncbi:bactofilin family protein [Shewanella surugensis]|uniref:Polymer-forming cytoskeletal protein n=1 Tax=Shewanella surugensis TaxID=212020 RepID=A0ABT0LBP4_9GAMM|nr:polymer-forming cytoskeletal protein [Shewanella surugensis]MCL1124920.1 polymer-forming cytoskeletal protein [Shewanella surugensis]
MFKKNKTGGLTFIAQGTKLTGDIQFTDESLISGELQGTILSTSNINIELDGFVEGELQCVELRVSGSFKGKLNCNKLNITSTGRVDGEVNCQSMEIFEGGQFIGMRVRESTELLSSSYAKPESVKQLEESNLVS